MMSQIIVLNQVKTDISITLSTGKNASLLKLLSSERLMRFYPETEYHNTRILYNFRYYAIVHPLSAMKINSKSRVRKIIACTWIIPLVVAAPYIYCRTYSFTIYSEYGVISREICNDRFNDIDIALYGKDTDRLGEFRRGYFLFLFIVTYVIPSVTIMITCIKIAVSLLQPITVENSAFGRKDTNRRQEENKRKVSKSCIFSAA